MPKINLKNRVTQTVFLGLGIAIGTVVFVPIVSFLWNRVRTTVNI